MKDWANGVRLDSVARTIVQAAAKDAAVRAAALVDHVAIGVAMHEGRSAAESRAWSEGFQFASDLYGAREAVLGNASDALLNLVRLGGDVTGGLPYRCWRTGRETMPDVSEVAGMLPEVSLDLSTSYGLFVSTIYRASSARWEANS